MEQVASEFTRVTKVYSDLGKKFASLNLRHKDLTLYPPGVIMSTANMDIHQVREKLVETLVEDFDSDKEMAEKAAMKVDQEHVDEYDDLDDLAEFVYGNQSFWND